MMIAASGEIGTVIGTAIFLGGRRSYLLRYCNNAGVAVEQWWDESALKMIKGDDNDMAGQSIRKS